MKKLLLFIVGLLLVVPVVGNATINAKKYTYTNLHDTIQAKGVKPGQEYPVTDDGVNVYLIWGNGCPHCTEFIDFISNYYKEFSHINIYAFEVWENSKNASLLDAAGKEFNTEVRGVPFIVIGDKTFSGYGKSMDDSIKTAIQNEYKKPASKRINKFEVAATSSTKTTTTTTTTNEVTQSTTITTDSTIKNYSNQSESKEEKKTEESKQDDNTKKYVIYGAAALIGVVFVIFIIKGLKK
jgi:hypothetical protein